MNQHLQNALSFIEQSEHLTAEEKAALLTFVRNADKELDINAFKLERTEKVKRTTGILLEETILELEQKRKAVEAQNRELEIEAALERVRTVALSMNKPDDMLEACRTISNQLELLNVKEIRNVQTAIFYEAKKMYSNFEYYAKHDKTLATETTYNNNEIHEAFATQMLKGAGEFFSTYIKDVHNWIAYQKTTNVFIDEYLYTASSLSYYWYSLGPVALGISTYAPLNDDELALFKRFRNVFELAYRRFMDIEQAMAQAREAQIEAALERVRSRAMAMHKTDELLDAAELLYRELSALGLGSMNVSYAFVAEDEQSASYYSVNPVNGKTLPFPFIFPHTETEVMRSLLSSWKKQEPFHVIELDEAATLKHQTYIGEHIQQLIRKNNIDIPFSIDAFLEISPKKAVIYSFNFTHGYLFNIGGSRLTTAQEEMLLRFTKVFEMTYRRFLDLQKAEAQAREAKIEAALERVRSRSMAMHKSEELRSVVNTLYGELQSLQVKFHVVGIQLIPDQSMDIHMWLSTADGLYDNIIHWPFTDIPVFHELYKARTRGEMLDYIMSETVTKRFFEEYFKLEAVPKERKTATQHVKVIGLSAAYQKLTGIFLMRYTEGSYSPQEKDIIARFSKAFEQTYTRFLDLQKAEAQSREAQIELALERVRARTMAMQRSDELAEVATILFQQVKTLGVPQWTCGFGIFEIDDEEFTWYPGSAEGDILPPVKIPLTEHPVFISFNESRKRGDELYVYEKEGEYQAGHYRYMQSLPGVGEMLQKMLDAGLSFPTFQIDHVANFSQGNLVFITYEPVPEMHDVFKRFAKVFEQTYTRFLDLQKAEGQSREAQIELGLERVRAKAMAMQKSDELSGLVATLFEELTKLRLVLFRCIIWIFDPETLTARIWMANSEDKQNAASYFIKRLDHPYYEAILEGWKERASKWVYDLQGTEKRSIDQLLLTETELSNLPEAVKAGILSSEHTIVSGSFNNFGLIEASGPVAETEEQLEILNRFGKVFDLTYTRFNDLQKAEAQAREAQIELGLERVRARAMAMQQSDELAEAAALLYHEFGKLDIHTFTCGYLFIDEAKNTQKAWVVLPDGTLLTDHIDFPLTGDPVMDNRYQAWKNKQPLHICELAGEANKEHHRFLSGHVPPFVVEEIFAHIPDRIICYSANFSSGYLFILATEFFSPEDEQTINRFAKVFEMTYTRFNDLKQAEANIREARIEAGLERVRARTMAMHNSEDVSIATATMFLELEKLGIESFRGGILNIRKNKTQEVWSINTLVDGTFIRAIGEFDMTMHPFWQQLYAGWENKDEVFSFDMSGQVKEDYVKILDARRDYLPNGLQHLPDCIVHAYYFSGGAIWSFSLQPHSEEHKQVMKKFASVFSLTFRRYQDLVKAEAQAKEARIEASLERVRSKAMAMHTSEDLAETIKTFYHQVEALSTIPRRLGIGIINKETHTADLTTMNTTQQGESIEIMGILSLTGHPVLEAIYEHWLSQTEYLPVLRADEIKQYYAIVRPQISYPDYPANTHQYGYYFFFPEGAVYAWTEKEMAAEDLKIYRRFTSVLSLTYRRFKELKEAEAQTRQAQIETAMEKVRARALAMQKPGELAEVATVLRKEMGMLGVEELETSSIYIVDEATGTTACWYAFKKVCDAEQMLVNDHMILQLADTWVGRQMMEFYRSGNNQISIPMRGDQRKEWIQHCMKQSKVIEGFYGDSIPDRIYHLNKFSNGFIGAASPGDISAESWDLLQRATTVFSLAYTRFSDLQKSEANTREAVRRAALDRVRAEIASMRTVADLEKITPLVWNELKILGIPFIRCGVFIMDDENEMIHTFLSTPEGKAIAAFHIPYQTPGNIGQVLQHWHKRMVYVDRWDEAAFTEFAATLVQQGALDTPEAYLKTIPHGGFYLHFLPFQQGMLYVGNTDPMGDEEISLIQSVAEAFSTAYARYEDFKKLESAKEQIENTLKDLKLAQTQLIQSEKMASLGELTAGIAHEIQNPLNFVNNFSEVNAELIEELEQEVLKGNYAEAHAIAKDIRENEQKINHHGKRADAIVKGMLEHSRSSTGIKVPTDINKLADEYLRLAYHGLRAKDKSFNATLHTDFDESLGPLNIIPQDIGRVLLNLINNAFYAVAEKKKGSPRPLKGSESYEPIITVSTKAVKPPLGGAGAVITIADNGNGIPQQMLDKIFQPFFTTKPTGHGTGLGLSLAYDIIKAHGGEIKVATKPDQGSEFIIHLPFVDHGFK